MRDPADTVYLCAVDGDRMTVSFIQSLFAHFRYGVVAPGTGVVLNNRAAGFSVAIRVEPEVRPYHTIIPGMLFRDGGLLGPSGSWTGIYKPRRIWSWWRRSSTATATVRTPSTDRVSGARK